MSAPTAGAGRPGAGGRVPRVIAHRGASTERPENSIPAFDLALELGADGIELDVRCTADGEPVVIHDPTLERTSDRGGAVASLPLARVREADLARPGGRERLEWSGPVRIPRLREVFQRYPGVELTVDVKRPADAQAVVDLIEAFQRVGLTILYVEEGTDGRAFRRYRGRRATSTAQVLRLATDPERLDEDGRDVPEVIHTPLEWKGRRLLDEALVARAQAAGRTVQVWTIDDPEVMRRMAEWKVDGIITDDVRAAREVLGA